MDAKTIILFIVGLVFLIKGGDWFVDGASGIAKRFRIPEILIGATVVSIGTTLPEVMVSATSALDGVGGIAYGNAIGSIICNTALIAAVTVAIKPSKAERSSLIVPVIFFFSTAIYYSVTAYAKREFSRVTGIVLLIVFVIYMVITVLMMKRKDDTPEELLELDRLREGVENAGISESEQIEEQKAELPAQNGEAVAVKSSKKDLILDIVKIVIGAVLIAFGADFLVDSATKIAEFFKVPESVIGLTIVALGTSLPELITAITSLIKGHGSLSLGNIIGANLFNLVLVSGVAITISPFTVPTAEVLPNGALVSLVLDIPVMLGVMAILIVPTLLRGKLSRIQGISLIAIYLAYCVARFMLV